MIHTKLAPPMWMGNQIRRDLLLARLDMALERRLTLIQAPAGYGKTSLLSQWKERFDPAAVLVAWLTLEPDDSDLRRLTRYIALALEGAAPHDMTGDDSDRMAASLPPRAAVSAIVNRLAQEKRTVVLILDDFHRAESPEVDAFVRSLIQLAPENCHFIVASRDYPWLGQSILAAEEQLVELTADDLKFSSHEAEALLARAHGECLDGDDVRNIVERTEGWPIALQLASLSLKRGADHRRLVEQFRGPSSELARYLSEQVLMTMPEETREIVIRTALLDRLTGDAVNMLCDRQDGWMVLERLEEQGVFLTPLTPERQAYRYHQLFAEHLRERLARRDTAQFRALHRRVAAWFAERGETAEAVSHAIQADDDAMLATILEDAGGWRLIPLGQQAMVERGLGKLPSAIVNARPRLALARVYLEIKCGELTTARADYDRIAASATDLSPDQLTEIRVVGDVLADYENEPVTLEDLLSREALLRTLPSDDHLVFANVSETLGAKYFEGGWLERALEPTLAAREHYQAMGSLYSDVFTRFLEARIRHAQGRVKDATAILASTRTEIEHGFGDRSDLAANSAAFEAELLYEQDQPAAAMALLEWAVSHMEQSDGWTDVYASAYFTAARALAADGSVEPAQEMIARARRLASRRRLRQLDLLAGLCELDLLIQHGDDDAAAHVAADAIGLDALANAVEADNNVHRPVVTAASLCRIKLALLDGENESALTELTDLRHWAAQHGAGRLLIDVNILLAFAHRATGDAAQARKCFDDAVGTAMFQGIARPFIDARRFAEPLLNETLSGTGQLDRFRGQFLKGVARTLASRPATGPAPGLLSDAEAAVLEHLGFGYSNKEIARLIGMSPDTVKYRLKSVFKKIGVHKRREAVRVLRERGLISGNGSAPAA